jgi:hypothetical protein
LLVGLLRPGWCATFTQCDLCGVHTRPDRRLAGSPFGEAHVSAPGHQDSQKVLAAIFGNRGIGGAPLAAVDDDLMPVVGSRRLGHEVIVFALRSLSGG